MKTEMEQLIISGFELSKTEWVRIMIDAKLPKINVP